MRNRVLVTVVVGGLLATACSGGGVTEDDDGTVGATAGETSSPTADATTEDASPTSDGSDGGTLVAAISSDPGSLNPAITTSGGVHTASELMFNGLVELDDQNEPVPSLADSWEVEEDGALYRFQLVEDALWHDGEPFTADDVVFSFEEVLLEYHSRTAASVGKALESVVAVDEHTVEFQFSSPYAPFLLQLGVTEAPIVPAHVYGEGDLLEHPANTEPVGTGPFALVSYTPDSEIRLERFEDYFKPDLPHLDEVVMRIIPDSGNALAALEAGEVDFLWDVPGPELDRVRGGDDYGFLETSVNPGGANCIMTISYNLDRELFQDVRTRRAIGHALDRQQFVDRVLFGQGRVAEAPIHSNMAFAHDPDADVPDFDTEAAEALLEEAGWVREGDGTRTASGVEGVEDGTELAFEFLSFPTFSSYGELVKAQLAEVGIDVTLNAQEPPVFAETVFTDRNFDTNVISYCNGQDPEIGVRRMYTSENIQPVPFSNSSGYSNEDVDRLFDEALTTVDVDARGEIYAELQQQLTTDMPYMWLVETSSVRMFSARCDGFQEAGHFAETAQCEE